MSIEFNIQANRKISVKYKTGEVFFTYSLWQLPVSGNYSIFGATNQYLSTLSGKQSDALFAQYCKANKLLTELMEQDDLLNGLASCVKEIYNQTSYKDVHDMCISGGMVTADSRVMETNLSVNADNTTYVRQQVLELTTYAVYIKLLAPIMGTLTKVLSPSTSNLFKEHEALRVIQNSGFNTEEPYKRLETYCTGYADRRKPSTSTAVKFKISMEDLESYLLGLFITRRLLPFSLTRQDTNIISYAFKFLEDKVVKLRQGHTDKMATTNGNSDNDQDSLIDHYRIAEDITIGVTASTNAYLKQTEKLLEDIGMSAKVSPERVREIYAGMVIQGVIIHDIVAPILDIVLYDAIHRKVINLVTREARLKATAVVAAVLEYHGLKDISLFITAESFVKEVNELTLGAEGSIVNPMDHKVEKDLIARYPHLPNTKHYKANRTPAHFYINEVVKLINSYTWGDGIEHEFVDIRNSLASLFITPIYNRQ